jgi:hypothetical protein
MKSFIFSSLFEALALVKRRGQRSWSLFIVPLITMFTLLMGSTAWAAATIAVEWDEVPASTVTPLPTLASGGTINFDSLESIGGDLVTPVTTGFTTVGNPLTVEVTITNNGTTSPADDLVLGNVSIPLPTGFSLNSSIFPSTVLPGNTATFQVTLDALAAGPYATAPPFTFSYNLQDGAGPQNFEIDFVGTVVGTTPTGSSSIDVLHENGQTTIVNGAILPVIPIGETTIGVDSDPAYEFTISNISDVPLTIGDAIAGTAGIGILPADAFTIVDLDTTDTIDPNALFTVPAADTVTGTPGIVTFGIRLNGTAATTVGEVINGTVTIINDTDTENPFRFPISATVIEEVIPPEPGDPSIDVLHQDGTISIVNGAIKPVVEIGTTDEGQASDPYVFTISNISSDPLTIEGIQLPPGFSLVDTDLTDGIDTTAATFVVPAANTQTGNPGTADFGVVINAGAVGSPFGTVTILNDTRTEDPFRFPIHGDIQGVTTGAEIEIFWKDPDTGALTKIYDDTNTEINFGFVDGGESEDITFVIRNVGTDVLIPTNLDFLPSSLGFTRVNTFPKEVAVGGQEEFTIRFAAPSIPGSYTSGVIIDNNDSTDDLDPKDINTSVERPFDFLVTAIVASPTQEIEVQDEETNTNIVDGSDTTSGTTINLGRFSVGESVSRIFKVRNLGNGALVVEKASVTGTKFEVVSVKDKPALPNTLATGEEAFFEVEFNTSEVGSFTEVVSFNNNDVDENPFNFTITAAVLAQAQEIEVWYDDLNIEDDTQEAVNLGDLAVGKGQVSRIFAVRNVGGQLLNLTALSPLSPPFKLIRIFPNDVLSGNTVTFEIAIDTSTAGTFSDSIEIFSTDDDENPFNFPIIVDVAVPAPQMNVLNEAGTTIENGTTVSVDFGLTSVGVAVSKNFTISNENGTDDLLLNQPNLPEGFRMVGVFPSSVPPGGTATFRIQMDAVTAGNFGGNISITNNDSDEDPFVFPIIGTVNSDTQEIKVWHGTIDNIIQEITDGTDTTPGTLITFPETDVNVAHEEVFTVKNIGNKDLFLTGLTVTPDDSLFEVVGTFPPIVAPQQAVEFRLKFNGQSTAERTIQLFNTDPDENPFDFPVTGVVRGDPGSNPDGTQTLTVTRTGEGVVTSNPTGISCGTDAADCIENYTTGVAVSLTATPDTGSNFKEWSGDCSGSVNPISVTMDAAKSCTAIFTSAAIETLTLTKPAQGTVVSESGNTLCGTNGDVCVENYTSGNSAQLTAHPDDGFVFDKWGGDCSAQAATNPITLIMSQSFSCTASFKSAVPVVATLTFTKPDNGTISTVDGKVDCGDTCTASYNVGDTIQISATSDAADFSNWEGDCTGTDNPLSITITDSMVNNWSCTATFQNKPSAEGDCFVSGGILDAETCIPAAPLDSENTSGDTTDSDVRGGLSKYSGPYKQRDTVTLIDPVKTAGVIKVEAADIGKKADIVVMGRHDSDLYPEGFVWYMMVEDNSQLGWTIAVLPHDPETQEPLLGEADLKALKTVDALPEYYTAYMYSGNFVYPGPLMIYFGYRVQGEKVILSSKPISITILPPPQ